MLRRLIAVFQRSDRVYLAAVMDAHEGTREPSIFVQILNKRMKEIGLAAL